MQKIDIDIYIGDTADTAKTNKLPAGVTSYNPYITWTLPKQIHQVRVGIRITNIENQQLLAIFKSVTTANYYQIPIGNGMNSKWNGLCFIQIQISQYIDYQGRQQFQFTSGGRQQNQNGYFVIDTNIQNLAAKQAIAYMWQKSIDENEDQDLIYHLQVSKHPLFKPHQLVLQQATIADVSSGIVDYKSIPLDIGNYFFRVRAFDGYDYSQWSDINCFKVKQFEPPKISNLTYTKTYNETGDVIIQFDIENKSDNYATVILYYSYTNDLTVQYPCILKQTSHIVPTINNINHVTLTWQTVKNAKGSLSQLKMKGLQKTNIIENVDLFLYAQPYYSGTYGQLLWTDIHLDNQRYDVITTGSSNVSYQYMLRTALAKVPTYSTHSYVGWNSDYYYQVKNNIIYLDKNYTKNYNYYKQFLNSVNNLLQNNIYNVYRNRIRQNYKIVPYIGWNSDLFYYINDNTKKSNEKYSVQQLLTENITVSQETYDQYHISNKFDSNYYSQYLLRYHKDGIYEKQNYKGFKFNIQFKGSFSLYVDGRTFRGNDKSEYTIKQQKNDVQAVDAWVMSDATDSDKDQGISVIPSYFKDTRFNPKYPDQMKLTISSGKDKNGNDFKVELEKLNWHYCQPSGDWTFTAQQQNKETKKSETVYIKVFGGSLQGAKDQDSDLSKIIEGKVVYKDFYKDASGYGKITFPDGKLIFQDNETQSPQYTMYPQYYDKTGYPVGISQLYWKCVKSNDLYIRCYNIVKSGSNTKDGYQYKNFSIVPSNGIYHCYFTNKTIPQLLKLKDNCFYDEFNEKCYCKVYNNVYEKTDKRYADLPQYLICHNDIKNQQQLWYFENQKQIFKKIDQETINGLQWQEYSKGEQYVSNKPGYQTFPLYFLTYQRKYITDRGISPELGQSCWNCGGTGKVTGTQLTCDICKGTGITVLDEQTGQIMKPTKSPFCNVAVPQYIPAVHGVYSANGFNGKQSAFNLVTKLKRDARRYTLGHHYDWGNQEKNQQILEKLNEFKNTYYPDLQYRQDCKNIIIGFKYKWLDEGSMTKVQQKKYLYVPVRTNGQIKYAWFEDKSKDTFKIDWSSVDNDDYIFVHRDTIQPQFKLSQGGFKYSKTFNLKSQGTKLKCSAIRDQGYYSDKSKYGIQSYYIEGDLSDIITQTYKKDSINQFISVKRTIFLDHKNVIKNSIVITYVNNFGETNRIYNFSFYQSSLGYNAYIILSQHQNYINKQIKIQYKYYDYFSYLYNRQENNQLYFNNYNESVFIPTSKIIQNTVVLKCRQLIQQESNNSDNNENSYSDIQIDKQFYQLIPNKKQDNSIFRLVFYYKNKPLKIKYNYKNKIDIPTYRYSLQHLVNNNNEYYIYGINTNIILDTIKLVCVDSSQRYKRIENYSNDYGTFVIDKNYSKYKEYLLKPIQIDYSYTLIKKGQFDIKFSNFVGYLLMLYVNVSTIKVYYPLQNGIDINITEYFDFYSGNTKVTSGQHVNVYLVLNTKESEILKQIFSNQIFVSYNGYSQSLYLQMPQVKNDEFRPDNGYDYILYYMVGDNRVQISKNYYSIDGDTVSLIGQNYEDIMNYIDIPIKVEYKAIVHKNNSYNSIEDSLLVIQNNNENVSNFNTVQLNNNYNLPNDNIQQFSCYYLNDAYILEKVNENYYTIDKNSGIFKPINSWLIGKHIFFIYQYKQFIYDENDYVVTPMVLEQKFDLSETAENIIVYYYDVNNISNVFSNLQQEWNLDIINYVNYNFYYMSNDNKNYLSEQQYLFQNGIFKLTTQNLLNIQIIAQRNEKISDSQYQINNNKLQFTNSALVHNKIVIRYRFLSAINIKNYTNGILTQKNNQIVLQQAKIKEKQAYIKEQYDINNQKIQYFNDNIDYETIDNWQIHYCDDTFNIDQFEYNENNRSIRIKKPINTIQKYIQLTYSTYQNVNTVDKYQQIIQFSTSNQIIKLQKMYVYDVELLQLTTNTTIPSTEYNIVSNIQSTIQIKHNLFDKPLFISYNQYIIKTEKIYGHFDNSDSLYITNKKIVDECQNCNGTGEVIKNSSKSTCENCNGCGISFKDHVQVTYTLDNSLYRIMPKTDYQIEYIDQIEQLRGFYVVLNRVNTVDYSNINIVKNICVTFEYKYQQFNDTNKNIHYLTFKNYDRNIILPHYNIDNVSISYQLDNNYYQLPQSSYKIKNKSKEIMEDGKLVYKKETTIQLNNDISCDKYLNKNLTFSYTIKNETKQLYTKIFNNDMSLAFTDKDSYVVMSHSFIVQDTFELFYQTEKGLMLIPRQHYYLDTGTQFFNAVVVLNQKTNQYKNYLNKRLEIKYKYIVNPRKIFNPQNQKFPYLDYIYGNSIKQNMQNYYSGYLTSQHIGYHVRPQPVYQGDQGIKLVANLRQYSDYAQYEFLYLQSFWDAYNTIHIGGMLNKSTRIILQYAPNGTPQQDNESWKDFIGVGSTFDEQLNHYIMPPLTYDMFVDTFDDSIFLTNVTYRLRLGVRGSNDSNTGSSEWIYSIPFTIDHDAVNPVNITDIKFDNWGKRLTVSFRIDDTQGDLYDIIGMAYSPNGKEWFTINLGDLNGRLQFLQSNKRNAKDIIIHKIIWKAASYNLKPSTSYRIKITANYTKYAQGDQPIFEWKTSLNPLLDYYQSELSKLQGGKQYYKFVREVTKKVQNPDGTFTYQQLDEPVEYMQRIQPYQRTITYTVLDENGQPLLDDEGNEIVENKTQIIDYYISQGQINQLYTKLDKIKNRPYKTVVQDGQYVTIPWGYRQYYNQDLTRCINIQGYNIWLRSNDEQYGQQRGQLIQTINLQIQKKEEKASYYSKMALYSEINTRRSLIRQGFYSNGFLNNVYDESDPTPFRFRIFIKPLTKSQAKYMKDQGLELQMYQVKYEFQLDFNQSFDSQFNKTPLRDLYSYTRNGVTNQIVAGIEQDSISSLYQGYFYLQNQKQPGKIKSDELPLGYSNYTHSYYWRIRPFTQLQCKKKEVARCNIKNVCESNDEIIITFTVTGQQDLGSLSIYKKSSLYNENSYYIYAKRKSQQDSINIIPGRRKITDNADLYENQQISIQTDRLRDKNGRVYYYQDYFKNWISFSPKRQRPSILIWQNQYYLFYDKHNVLSQTTMYLSLSKDGNTFGEYSQVYPYNPNESLNKSNFEYLKNGFVMRNDQGFLMFANSKLTDSNINQIYYLQSNWNGDEWNKPRKCEGLSNCTYPSIIKTKSLIQSEQSYQQIDIYIMLCQKNNNFEFYYSFNLTYWKSIIELPDNYKILQNVDFRLKINKNTVKLEPFNILQEDDSSSSNSYDGDDNSYYNNINYYSPYLFKDNNKLYVYFGTYDSVTKVMNVYRTVYNNGWSDAQLIVENAFNPCVIKDYYYGNQLHRVYFNRIKPMKYNGQIINDYVINNVFVTNFDQNNQIINIPVSRITSNQIKAYSLDNISAGYHYKCDYCNGSGKYNKLQCPYCKGLGYIDQIQYKIHISKNNIFDSFDNYDYFIRLDKNYENKIVRKYGDWYNYENAIELDQIIRPVGNYKYINL